MSKLPVYQFDPKYTTDTDGFSFDLAAWLGDSDTLIGLPTSTVTPNTATIASTNVSGSLVTVWIAGGVAGAAYTLDIRIQTQAGRDCRVRGTFSVEA